MVEAAMVEAGQVGSPLFCQTPILTPSPLSAVRLTTSGQRSGGRSVPQLLKKDTYVGREQEGQSWNKTQAAHFLFLFKMPVRLQAREQARGHGVLSAIYLPYHPWIPKDPSTDGGQKVLTDSFNECLMYAGRPTCSIWLNRILSG